LFERVQNREVTYFSGQSRLLLVLESQRLELTQRPMLRHSDSRPFEGPERWTTRSDVHELSETGARSVQQVSIWQRKGIPRSVRRSFAGSVCSA
jgi:hypothetical protein